MKQEPDGPYIYQPFGMQDKENWKVKRIYGIGGLPYLAVISGLTKEEATKVLQALTGEG